MGERPDCTKQLLVVALDVGEDSGDLKALGDSPQNMTACANVVNFAAWLNQRQRHEPG